MKVEELLGPLKDILKTYDMRHVEPECVCGAKMLWSNFELIGQDAEAVFGARYVCPSCGQYKFIPQTGVKG